MKTIQDLINHWKTDEGRPYRGDRLSMKTWKSEFIDWRAYNDPDNEKTLSLMSAQGQVLHVLGGYSPEQLYDMERKDADKNVANLLNISTSHSALLRRINYRDNKSPATLLEKPEKIIGGRWSQVFDFWHHIDAMTNEQWANVVARQNYVADGYDNYDDYWWSCNHARDVATFASRDLVGASSRDDVRESGWGLARSAAAKITTNTDGINDGLASNEIQGQDKIDKFFFLPMFGFKTPADIPARPSDYGPFGEAS